MQNGEDAASTRVSLIAVGGQTLRVGVRPGSRDAPSLLIFNGIGANLDYPLVVLISRVRHPQHVLARWN